MQLKLSFGRNHFAHSLKKNTLKAPNDIQISKERN